MIKIINCGIEAFKKQIENKNLYLFGAGRRAIHLCETLYLADKLDAIIDNNSKLQNTFLYINDIQIPIISLEDFIKKIAISGKDKSSLVITSAFYAWDIIQQLDAVQELDGMECYDMNLLLDFYESSNFSFTKGQNQIPKKIHYCWVGENDIPKKLQRCIESWKIYCPDYEIIRWDEGNYDFSKNQYMQEAYENKKWGFVPDYARLDIIYQEGGIYLDTDVELIAPLDVLLNDDAFLCADSNLIINLGQGFGAQKGNTLIKDLRDYYDDKSFIKEDGTLNVAPCYMYQHPILIKHGFEIKNIYQKVNGMVIYPSEVSAPTGRCGIFENFTEKTVSIHHNEFSWIEKEEHLHYEKYKRNILNRVR